MNNENFVVVYWNKESNKPFYHYGNESVPDMHEFARQVVPHGTHYNIVEKKDINNFAVPKVNTTTAESEQIRNLFYQYFEAL